MAKQLPGSTLLRASWFLYRGALHEINIMIYKLCTSCGRKVPEGTTCPCRKIRRTESNRLYDKYQRDRRSTAFYNSAEWERVRLRVLNMDRLDVYLYMTQDKVVPADTVHHITPLRDDWSKRLDINNLMSLHHDTHSTIEREYATRGAKSMAYTLYILLRRFREKVNAGEI